MNYFGLILCILIIIGLAIFIAFSVVGIVRKLKDRKSNSDDDN